MGMHRYKHTVPSTLFPSEKSCSLTHGGVCSLGDCLVSVWGLPQATTCHAVSWPPQVACQSAVWEGVREAFSALQALLINPSHHVRSIDLCTQPRGLMGMVCTKQTNHPLGEPDRASKLLSAPVCSISVNTGVHS